MKYKKEVEITFKMSIEEIKEIYSSIDSYFPSVLMMNNSSQNFFKLLQEITHLEKTNYYKAKESLFNGNNQPIKDNIVSNKNLNKLGFIPEKFVNLNAKIAFLISNYWFKKREKGFD